MRVPFASYGFREMIAQRALRQFERLGRYKQDGRIRAARDDLADPAVAVEHHNGFGAAFVANRPTLTSPEKRRQTSHGFVKFSIT